MAVPRSAWRDERDQDEGRQTPVKDLPAIRVSDGERDGVAALLKEALGEGRLTLGEFGERLDLAYAARTRAELTRLTVDLPGTDPIGKPTRQRRVMLGILFDSRRAGPQPLDDEITAIAFFGDVIIDLREAKVTSNEITICAYALLNDVDIIVPAGVAVELSGVAIIGDNRNKVEPVPAGTSRFVVKVDGHAVLGDVHVLNYNPRATRATRRRSIER